MNEFEPFFQSVAQVIGDHRKASPAVQAGNHLGFGAMILTACLYVAGHSEIYFGGPVPFAVHRYPIVAGIWAAVALLACIWIVLGIKGPPEPRNNTVMKVFWSLVIGGVSIYALNHWWFPLNWGPRDWIITINVTIRGICTTIFIGAAVDIFLALRGRPSDAQKIVSQQIEQNAINWRGVKRR